MEQSSTLTARQCLQRSVLRTKASGIRIRATGAIHAPRKSRGPDVCNFTRRAGALCFRGSSVDVLFSKRGNVASRGVRLARARVVQTDAYQVESSQTYTLKGGAHLTVEVSGSQISITVSPPPGAERRWRTPQLVLHWGMVERDGNWKLPEQSNWPTGTKNYKKKALRTPLVFNDSSAPNGGSSSITINVAGPASYPQALAFCLVDMKTRHWHKNGPTDFMVYLGEYDGAQVPDQMPDVMLPDELVRVWAYHHWEKAGKPNLTPSQSLEELIVAEQAIIRLLREGRHLDELMQSMGLAPPETQAFAPAPAPAPAPAVAPPTPCAPPPPPLKAVKPPTPPPPPKAVAPPPPPAPPPAPTPPPPPSPVKAAAPAPAPKKVVVREVPEELIGIMGYIMWERAGQPDGADFGAEAERELRAALETGLSASEVKHRLKTGIPLFEPGQGPPPAPAKQAPKPSQSSGGSSGGKHKMDAVNRPPVDEGLLIQHEGAISGNSHFPDWMKDRIISEEPGCTRSFMHRFNAALGMLNDGRGSDDPEGAMTLLYVWLRFCEIRQLVWNKNYNIKPREISAAQTRLTDTLCDVFKNQKQHRQLAHMCMAAVGRGAEGNAGQRIRDEILDVQRANDVMGGFMEEWHQKLHNNTTPDDVAICQAILDYLEAGLDINQYWNTLHANGIDKERLLSYDRSIHSEPNFRQDQIKGLTRDLNKYMVTLKAVHSGADLDSATKYIFGYSQDDCKGSSVSVSRIDGVATPELERALQTIIGAMEANRSSRLKSQASSVDALQLLEAVVGARQMIRPHIVGGNDFGGRLKDVVYLDLALETTGRVVVEGALGDFEKRGVAVLMKAVGLALENVCLSLWGNNELVLCWKEWQAASQHLGNNDDWALRTKAALDRIQIAVQDVVERYNNRLQPAAVALGGGLGVDHHAIDIFTEEVVRGTSAAPLSQLLRRVDPLLRQAADLGSWQVISAVNVKGFVEVVDDIATVQNDVYSRPTVIVAGRVSGEEEIPEGCVGVLTSDMPDVLAHISVRARNEGVAFCTCFDPDEMRRLQTLGGTPVTVAPAGNEVSVTAASASEVSSSSSGDDSYSDNNQVPRIQIEKRVFRGQWCVASDEFEADNVGGKSRNLQGLRGRLPENIKLPVSTALPFGVCDQVIAHPVNASVKASLDGLLPNLDVDGLDTVQQLIRSLQAPPELVEQMRSKMAAGGQPFPGNAGQERWEAAWRAITGVWASKWNQRSFISCRKAGIAHEDISMAVLCQEVVQAEYSFVIHTTHPQTGNTDEIYAEVVRGLGEVLVGNYPGRALSFVAKKSDLKNPQVTGFPSKNVGLFAPPSMIFRSDSNGEDLEGYAGAGLYDSIIMDASEERPIDYSKDLLVQDVGYQKATLAAIAYAGLVVENLLGSPQDIEGCITANGDLVIVQTRPQV